MATTRTPIQREALLKARADYITARCDGPVDVLRERMELIKSLDYCARMCPAGSDAFRHGLRDIVELAPGLIEAPL